MATKNTFGAAAELRVNDATYQIFRLDALEKMAAGVKFPGSPIPSKFFLKICSDLKMVVQSSPATSNM